MTLRTLDLPSSLVSAEQKQSLMQALLLFLLAFLALSAHSILTVQLGAIGMVWLVAITTVSMFVSLEFAFALLMSGLFLQNAFTALAAPLIIDPSKFSLLLGSTLVNIFLSAVISGMIWLKWRAHLPPESNTILLWLAAFVGALVLYAVIGAHSSSLSNAVIYSRVYMMGPLMLAIGAMLGLRLSFGYVVNVVRLLAILLVVWGCFEFFMTYDLYQFFHILDFINLKSANFEESYLFGGIKELITNDTNTYLNLSGQFGLDFALLRPKGPNIHTISYGYALIFCCLVCFMSRLHVLALACFIMAVLVGAKGPLILTISAVLLCLFYEKMRNTLWLSVGLIIAMGTYLSIGLVYGTLSQDYHVLGFMGGLHGFFSNPFGHGIGVGGNMSSMGLHNTDFQEFQHLGTADFALESAFGVMLYQLGIGTAIFLIFYWKLWRHVWKAVMFFSHERRLVVVPIVLAMLLINSVFQEEAFSPLGWGLWLLLGGLLLGRHWATTVFGKPL